MDVQSAFTRTIRMERSNISTRIHPSCAPRISKLATGNKGTPTTSSKNASNKNTRIASINNTSMCPPG
ncbi:hypothetical protein FRC18_001478 [Serendipita sp. 400]|nr:hypothetical protein FRC18_001478 [Serendipita sp. 400]